MRFRLQFYSGACRELRRLDARIRNRIERAIEDLSENPYPQASLRLKGIDRACRIMVDAFRVVYEVHEELILVTGLEVDRRNEDTYRI